MVAVCALLGPARCSSRSLRRAGEAITEIWTPESDLGLGAAATEPNAHDIAAPPAKLPKVSQLLAGSKVSAYRKSINGTASWGSDIFQPSDKFSSLMAGSTRADWLLLSGTVLVLVMLDVFFLSRFTDESKLPEDTRSMLRSVFDACGHTRNGCATKRDLVSALARCKDVSILFGTSQAEVIEATLAPMTANGQDSVSWETFEAFYTRTVFLSGSSASRSRGMGSIRAHVGVLLVWVLVAAVYNGVVFIQKGADAGMQWCTGYVLEWLLSMDNLFVFHLIFQAYSTPRALLQKALFIGIIGAVVCRMGFFALVSSLMDMFHGIRFLFALLLIYSGVQAAREDEDEDEGVADNAVVRLFQRIFGTRIRSEYDMDGRMYVWENGRWEMTLLVPVIMCLVISDLLFALDSVSAKVAQIPNFYIAYSSSVLALFGLRSMFFIIQSLVDAFELLKYGLCFILVFIGIELMIAPFVKLPASAVMVVILAVFMVCIAGSVGSRRPKGEDQDETEQSPEAYQVKQVAAG